MADLMSEDLALNLVNLVAQGREDALTQLHHAYSRKVYSFVFQRLGNEHWSQEVVHETFWEVWTSAQSFRAASKVSTWLLGIARFKALELLRQHRRNHEDIDDHQETLVCPLPTGEHALVATQSREQVQQCLRTLSAAQRECVHLVYFDELPQADVAQVLDIPVGTVKTRIMAAKEKLRACLERLLG